jgi:AbrB family looped-hinge helix DNA binding protein
MSDIRTQIDSNGRILIPASIRKQFEIKTGDVFVLRVIDGEIHMVSLNKVIDEAQQLIRQYVPEGVSMVDELMQMRREEFLSEEEKYK